MSEIVQVSELPPCNFHEDCVATYDFKTRQGPWANGCFNAYMANRAHGTLGTGKGQVLTTDPVENELSDRGRRTLAMLADDLGMPEDELLMMADDMGMSDLFD